jgi:hypothetical protein
MSWLNVDFVVCLALLVQSGVIVFLLYNHHKTVVQLMDRIMAKNYGEIVQGQVLIKTGYENKAPLDIKVAPEDIDPNGAEALNKLL